MGHFDVRTNLTLHLRSGSSRSRPEQETIAQHANPQFTSALVQLPIEIKELIFQELWRDAGLSQHLILGRGRVVGMKCTTDVTAPDELQATCQKTKRNETYDSELWRRLESSWGVHWKCEELYRSKLKAERNERRPFLPLLVTCRQIYVEASASIHRNVTFCTHDIDTVHSLAVSSSNPILNNIRHLQVTVRLRLSSPDKPKSSYTAAMLRWRQCCEALEHANNLDSVYLWLDAEPRHHLYMNKAQGTNTNPYVFGEKLAAKLTVDAPLNPERPEAWDVVVKLEPQFTVHPRGWPKYKAIHDGIRKEDCIVKLPRFAEPGVPWKEGSGKTFVHPGRGLFSAMFSKHWR
ncbi:hypothetical protein FVEN_g760 [Fusarium venenatum]|uniref:uncharacterized protein n=1 Tax=Fusarium venenatum TaxID=56646 RepID=UPI001E03CF92|nr:hypothetical protein FVEN_g760 [Fusarium venenatum]KAH6967410.1 hypothetical protein EDB82DRAFT_518478 [Fusarium venenatum]